MTVNDYKETACATAGAVEEDMEVDTETTLQAPVVPQDSEHLLGRVLAGKNPCFVTTYTRRVFILFY